jgi:hypothetical protein
MHTHTHIHTRLAVRTLTCTRTLQIRGDVLVALSTVGRGEQIVRYKLAHLYLDIFHRMGPRGAYGLCFLSRCDKTHGVRASHASRRCRVRLR